MWIRVYKLCRVRSTHEAVSAVMDGPVAVLAFVSYKIICKRTDANCSLHPKVFQGIVIHREAVFLFQL